MKKIFIPIIVIALLIAMVGGYYWWQKNQTIILETGQAPCETLKDIPSADYAPKNVRQRFLECFPERVTSTVPSAPTEQGPTCEQLKAIPSAQYAPTNVRDKFLECFPKRK